jgi:hypothetical protein
MSALFFRRAAVRYAASALFLWAGPSAARAADVSWRGAGTGGNSATDSADAATQWAVASNWQGGAAPGDADHARLAFDNLGTVHGAAYRVEDLTLSGAAGVLRLESTDFQVDDFLTLLGSARLMQASGTHSIGRGFKIDGSSGTGAYTLAGGILTSGVSVPWWDADVEIGRGGFTQTGGVHEVAHDMWVRSSLTDGGYRLADGRLDVPYELRIYGASSTMFEQSGGQLDVFRMWIAVVNGTSGRLDLTGGVLNANSILLGNGGQGQISQSGGTMNVATTFTLGNLNQAAGYYELSGGTLNVANLQVAREASGSVMQTGGVANVTGQLTFSSRNTGNGRYEIVDGELNVHHALVGGLGAERMIQRGGQVSADVLALTDNGVYEYYGGELDVQAGLDVEGTMAFLGHGAVLNFGPGRIVDLSGNLLNAANSSWSIGAESLTILKAGFNPASTFASYANAGHVMVTGTTFVLPAGQTIRGGGDLDEFLEVRGRLEATTGNALDPHGLTIAVGGVVDLGNGQALLDRGNSGNNGGELRGRRMTLSTPFAHTAGSVTLTEDLDVRGSYALSGGQLTAKSSSQVGAFVQTGGQATYAGNLQMSGAGANYTLSDGRLTTASTGMWSASRFTQTGGMHETAWLRTITRAVYEISGGRLVAPRLGVGEDAGGTVNVSGTAVVEVADRLTVSSSGQMTMTGGLLRAESIETSTSTTNTLAWTGGRIELHKGSGRLTNNGGVLAPTDVAGGDSTSKLVFTGNFTQSAGSLELDLGGLVKGTQYDHIQVIGNATLGGLLTVVLADDFEPKVGDAFELIAATSVTGTFGTLNLPALETGVWRIAYGSSSVVLRATAPADLNADGLVDSADLLALRQNFGASGAPYLVGDIDGDGVVTGQDFLAWQRQVASAAPTAIAAPEPFGSGPLVIAVLAAGRVMRRRYAS